MQIADFQLPLSAPTSNTVIDLNFQKIISGCSVKRYCRHWPALTRLRDAAKVPYDYFGAGAQRIPIVRPSLHHRAETVTSHGFLVVAHTAQRSAALMVLSRMHRSPVRMRGKTYLPCPLMACTSSGSPTACVASGTMWSAGQACGMQAVNPSRHLKKKSRHRVCGGGEARALVARGGESRIDAWCSIRTSDSRHI